MPEGGLMAMCDGTAGGKSIPPLIPPEKHVKLPVNHGVNKRTGCPCVFPHPCGEPIVVSFRTVTKVGELLAMNVIPCNLPELAQALFEGSMDALLLCQPESEKIIHVNATAQSLTGLDRCQLSGEQIATLVRCESPEGMQRLRDALRNNESFPLQDGFWLRRQHEAESWLPVSLSATPLRTQTVMLALLTARDRREQQRLREQEAELHLTKKKWAELHNLFKCTPVGLALFDSECRYLLINEYLANINGKSIEEHLGNTPLDILPADLAHGILQRLQLVLSSGQSVHDKELLCSSPGNPLESRVWEVSYHPHLVADRTVQGVYVTHIDITKGKEAESALIESRERFTAFMNSIPMIGFIKDIAGRFVYLNKAFADTFDRPDKRYLGKFDHEVWPRDIANRLHDADQRVIAADRPLELREYVPTPDGTLREWWLVKFSFRDAHGQVLLGGVALDLSERRQLEEALRRSEERYRTLWHRNLAGIFRATRDGRILDCNDSFARIFGYQSRDDILQRSTTEFYFDLGVRNEFLTRLQEQLLLTNYELCMRRNDGSPVWVLENVSLLREGNEEILEGTLIDITERKRAEEALRASETNYRTLINHLDQGIFLKDSNLRYVIANDIFCTGVRRTVAELRGKTISEIFPVHLIEKTRMIERQILREGRAIQTEDVMKILGKPRVVRVNRTPVKDDGGNIVGVLGICWDVTDQRAMEAQLRHVQKMDAIGQLAGGIAHDFNNLLTIMLGNLSFILKQGQDLHTILELVRNAEKAGHRAAELTQTLLGFARRTALSTSPFNLQHAIDEVIRLVRATLPTAIVLEVRTQPHLWLVQAEAGQLNQVLTNLTLNARDAMPHGGTICYHTSHFVPDADYLASHVEARAGEFVRLRVEDTGLGIPANIRQRIFEPFFTTKEKGKGTGLGLAIVFSIVKAHNGWIVCESEPNRGTCFDIFLPRCLETTNASPADEPMTSPLRNTILLVDDEHIIRLLSQTILSKAGYQTLLAENGVQALEVFRANQDQIVLVILDAIMPRLSGRETLRELARIKPDVRVLFSSGFSTEQLSLTEFPQVRDFLPKPYRAEQLIEKVRDILASASKQ